MPSHLPGRIAPSAAHQSRYFPRAYAGGAEQVSLADRRFTTRPGPGLTRGSPALVTAGPGMVPATRVLEVDSNEETDHRARALPPPRRLRADGGEGGRRRQ